MKPMDRSTSLLVGLAGLGLAIVFRQSALKRKAEEEADRASHREEAYWAERWDRPTHGYPGSTIHGSNAPPKFPRISDNLGGSPEKPLIADGVFVPVPGGNLSVADNANIEAHFAIVGAVPGGPPVPDIVLRGMVFGRYDAGDGTARVSVYFPPAETKKIMQVYGGDGGFDPNTFVHGKSLPHDTAYVNKGVYFAFPLDRIWKKDLG